MTRKELIQLGEHLKQDRYLFIEHWRELAENILPRRIRLDNEKPNRGDKRNQKIKDETATLALRTLRAGMQGGITSSTRPWFNLTTSDFVLRDQGTVKEWLYEVNNRMRSLFLKSNLYQVLPLIYGDLGLFATAAMGVEDIGGSSVFRFNSFPIGSYMFAIDSVGRPNIFIREFYMTTKMIVSEFTDKTENGTIIWDNISNAVKTSYEQMSWNTWHQVTHYIVENSRWKPTDVSSPKYHSIYLETGQDSADLILREHGFQYFPVLIPRWQTTGEDIYGTDCPGMTALPAVKQLHIMEKRAIQAVEKMVNPPMMAPTSMKTQKVSILPGSVTYADVRQGMEGFVPVLNLKYNLQDHEAKAEQVRIRIRKSFFEDIFLMFATMPDRDRVTALEIQERKEEKLIALGPVLEGLNQDLLDPLIDVAFHLMAQAGLLPEPPTELQGGNLDVEYISILHQAQKSAGLVGIDKLKRHAAEMAELNPLNLDKFDFDKITDSYAEVLGIAPTMLRPDVEVDQIRKLRAQQQQAQAEAEQAIQMAKVNPTAAQETV